MHKLTNSNRDRRVTITDGDWLALLPTGKPVHIYLKSGTPEIEITGDTPEQMMSGDAVGHSMPADVLTAFHETGEAMLIDPPTGLRMVGSGEILVVTNI